MAAIIYRHCLPDSGGRIYYRLQNKPNTGYRNKCFSNSNDANQDYLIAN